MLSQKTKYAIRAVLYLSNESCPEKVKNGKDVAKALKTPLEFTKKILLQLSKAGIIVSNKGPGGGFYIPKKNLNLSLIKIVETMEDTDYFTSCGLGLDKCSDKYPCPIHDVFKLGRDKLFALLKNKTIGELAKEVSTNKFYLAR